MAVERILLRGGSLDGEFSADGDHPDTLFRIDDVKTRETYARVDDERTASGLAVAVFQLDGDGHLVDQAKRRFAPELP
jgi:hypothetical protein